MPRPTRQIDTHQHVFWHQRNDRGLIADMDEHGIEYAWLLSWEIRPEEDTEHRWDATLNPTALRADGSSEGIPLRDLILARDRYPERFVLGYCPHPTLGDAARRFEAAVKMHGARVCGEWKFRMLFDDPRCLELFHAAGALQTPVVLHLDVPYRNGPEGKPVFQKDWYGGTVENLERALSACPETTFIGHAPGFWREISGDAAQDPAAYPKGPVTPGGRLYGLFERHANLYADLSAGSGRYALARDPAHALKFLNRFGKRLLFARDYYGKDLHTFLSSLDLAPDLVEDLYQRNAERLVKRS